MIPVTDALLQEMAEAISQAVHPRQIILFGSHARGTAGPDSDVDLIVVEDEPFGPERSRRKEVARILRSLAPFKIPLDVLVYSDQEIRQWRTTKNHLIAHATREGKVLYDRH
jgi:predicted nucleotidyltransferase